MRVQFTKMHGLGNDFIFIEDLDGGFDPSPEAVASLCRRRFGIGADGLILVRRVPDSAQYYMHYYNADGSLAEMCGNGIRCFAKYLVDRGLMLEDSFAVHTRGGLKDIKVQRDASGRFASATVDMGQPVLDPTLVPVVFDGDIMQECPVETSMGFVNVTAVSMGNPHAVLFVDDVNSAPVLQLGPELERSPLFPQRTNVEFVEVCDFERLCIRVWERGVGETQACGTGACASVVAAALSCRIGREAVVELPGGELVIEWQAGGSVFMTGPATEVFSGAVDIA